MSEDDATQLRLSPPVFNQQRSCQFSIPATQLPLHPPGQTLPPIAATARVILDRSRRLGRLLVRGTALAGGWLRIDFSIHFHPTLRTLGTTVAGDRR